jgi:hypothetical protein
MASKHEVDEEGGELIMAGCAAWSMAGRSGPTRNFDGIPFEGNLLLGFHRVGSLVHSKTLITHVFTGPVASHTICLDTSRQAYAWGRNEDGQLGLGDTTNRYNPTLIESVKGRVKSGACGPNHTLLYTTLGELYVTGRNDNAQLGNGNTSSKNSFQVVESLRDVVSVSAGRDFSCAVVESGNVYTWGHPEVSVSIRPSSRHILQIEKKKEVVLFFFFFFSCVEYFFFENEEVLLLLLLLVSVSNIFSFFLFFVFNFDSAWTAW